MKIKNGSIAEIDSVIFDGKGKAQLEAILKNIPPDAIMTWKVHVKSAQQSVQRTATNVIRPDEELPSAWHLSE